MLATIECSLWSVAHTLTKPQQNIETRDLNADVPPGFSAEATMDYTTLKGA
jgi:hypothetical protein